MVGYYYSFCSNSIDQLEKKKKVIFNPILFCGICMYKTHSGATKVLSTNLPIQIQMGTSTSVFFFFLIFVSLIFIKNISVIVLKLNAYTNNNIYLQ